VDKEHIPQSHLPDSQIGEPDATGFSLLEQSQVEPIIDEDVFNGFNEPFILEETNNLSSKPHNSTPNKSNSPISMGSAEWSRGWATDTNGKIVHVGFFFNIYYVRNKNIYFIDFASIAS
jgi:hypothetical protein